MHSRRKNLLLIQQLKAERAVALEKEVLKLQTLVKLRKNESEFFSGDVHMQEAKNLQMQLWKIHQDVQTSESELTKMFGRIRQGGLSEKKVKEIEEMEKEILTLENKCDEILAKEELAKKKFFDIDSLEELKREVEEEKEETKRLELELEKEREREQIVQKKVLDPIVCDEHKFYVSSRVREKDSLKGVMKGDMKR